MWLCWLVADAYFSCGEKGELTIYLMWKYIILPQYIITIYFHLDATDLHMHCISNYAFIDQTVRNTYACVSMTTYGISWQMLFYDRFYCSSDNLCECWRHLQHTFFIKTFILLIFCHFFGPLLLPQFFTSKLHSKCKRSASLKSTSAALHYYAFKCIMGFNRADPFCETLSTSEFTTLYIFYS